jgi:hypothetical protein
MATTTKTFAEQLRTFKQQRCYAYRHDQSWHLSLADYLKVFNSGTGECDCGSPASGLRKRDYNGPYKKDNMVLSCGPCARVRGRHSQAVRTCKHCGDPGCDVCPRMLVLFEDDPQALYFYARLAALPKTPLSGEPGDAVCCKSCRRPTCEQCVPLAQQLFHGDTASLRLHLRSINRRQQHSKSRAPKTREPIKPMVWTDYSKLFTEL